MRRSLTAAAVALALALPAAARGQAAPATSAPPFTSVTGSFFAISVADIAASVRWYEEKLGLKVVMAPRGGNGITVAALEGGGLLVELIQNDSAGVRVAPASGKDDPSLVYGIFKAGLIVTDLAGTLEALKQRGVELAFGPYPARNGQMANAAIRDNSGNRIQLFQAR